MSEPRLRAATSQRHAVDKRSYPTAARTGALVILPLLAVIVGWWLISELVVRNTLTLPGPGSTAQRAGELVKDGALGTAFVSTMQNILGAYLLALGTGIPLGLVLGRIRPVRLFLGPIVSFMFTAPKSAFYPAIMVLFGLGAASKIAFGFLLAFFQIVIAASAAASQIEDRLLWSARSLGTSRLGLFARVVLPATAPGAMAGARVGLVGAIVGVFLGEMVSGADGLGQLMVRSRVQLDSPTVYVVIVAVAVIAIVLDSLIVATSRRFFRWAQEG